MEQVVVYKRNGTAKYELLSEEPFRTITSAKMQMQHMANDYVQLSLQTADKLSFEIGDYISIRGRRYSIRSMADITMQSEENFVYAVTFYGVMYELMKYQFRNAAKNGRSSSATFDLTYTLKEFIKVLVNNATRNGDTSWSFDEADCPDTEPKTLSFDKKNCLTALQTITTEFDKEFRIEQTDEGKIIHIGEFGDEINKDVPFEYGEGSGLYQLQETKVDDSIITNRLWAEGGTENIVSGYRDYAGRLQLPLKRKSTKSHTLDNGTVIPAGSWIGIADEKKRYVDEDVLEALSRQSSLNPYNSSHLLEKYGPIEDTVVFDDVTPTKTFTVTSLPDSSDTRLTFACDIDFDLNAHWKMPSPHVGDATYEANAEADFQEWCYVRRGMPITAAQYVACYDFFHADNSDAVILRESWSSFEDYFVQLTAVQMENVTFLRWAKEFEPTMPAPPEAWDEKIYEQFEIFAKAVNNNDTKYLADSARVVFVTGKLAGQEFPIQQYTHAAKRFKIKPQTDETETVFPSEDEFGAFRITVGDAFKLTGIYLPYTYYQEAEEELWFAAYNKFEDVKYPSYVYKLTFDQFFVNENSDLFASIQPGDYIFITDTRFALTKAKMRVSSVDIDLLNSSYSLTLESIHKQKTRYGFSMQYEVAQMAVQLEMARLDDPIFRRGTRTNSVGVLSRILDANSHLREVRVADDFIATRMVAPSAIVSAKLADGAVLGDKIAVGAVVSEKIAANAIIADKIAANAVEQGKIAADAVLRGNIKNGEIVADKIANGAIVSAKLADGAIVPAKVSPTVIFARQEFTPDVTASDGKVIISEGTFYNSLDGRVEVPYTELTLDIDGNAIDPQRSYHIFYNRDSRSVAVSEQAIDGHESLVEIGQLSARDDRNNEHMVDIPCKPLQPISADRLSGGTLRFTNRSGKLRAVADTDTTANSASSTANSALAEAQNATYQLGSDSDTDSVLGRLKIQETLRSTHASKINEVIDSIYSANQILVDVQNNFNSLCGKLAESGRGSIISDSEKTALTLGIQQCTYNPIQQREQCVSSPSSIGVPDRL